MTSIYGSASTPKDFKFENLLRLNFPGDKMDQIIYYDTGVFNNPNMQYGKIIVGNEYLYVYAEAISKFIDFIYYGDIQKIELINDVPNFIFGPLKSQCIHIRIEVCKMVKEEIRKDVIEVERVDTTNCCGANRKVPKLNSNNSHVDEESNHGEEEEQAQAQLLRSTKMSSLNGTLQRKSVKYEIYVMNALSPILSFLKKAHLDFLIRHNLNKDISLSLSESSSIKSTDKRLSFCQAHDYELPTSLVNKLFDDLIHDLMSQSVTESNLDQLGYYHELYQAGLKYPRIKILFWIRTDLYPFIVDQFVSNICHYRSSITDGSILILIRLLTIISTLNDCLRIFLIETDHLSRKFEALQRHCGRDSLKMIGSVMELIGSFYDSDMCDVHQSTDTNDSMDIDLDLLKYKLVIQSVELFYYLIRSAEVPYQDFRGYSNSSNNFSILTIVKLLLGQKHVQLDNKIHKSSTIPISMVGNTDNFNTFFLQFVDYVIHTLFPWIFPANCRSTNGSLVQLTNRQIITIFQFFSSLRSLLIAAPDLLIPIRLMISEEFHHFDINPIFFESKIKENNKILQLTSQMIWIFQKNMKSEHDFFLD